MHVGRFTREARITTNIAHLSATRLKPIEFPLPPIAEQKRLVEIVEDHLSSLDKSASLLLASKKRLGRWLQSVIEAYSVGAEK
jgi:type I restriction enzyme S subunit